MKKIILILLCVGAFSSCCIWYPTPSEECIEYVDFILGGGKSWIAGNESWKDPFAAQVSIETKFHEISDYSSFRTGLGFSFQGSSYEEPGFAGKVSLSYINIPVLFNYQSNSGIYGEIGLQPGFLLSAKDKVDGDQGYSYRDFVKKFELGLPVGGGYWLNEQLSLGIRATFGITNLDNTGSEIADHNILIVAVARYRMDWPENK